MTQKKFLCIQRSQPSTGEKPSPAQLQQMYAQFNTWREKFRDNILDMGGKLGGGKVVTSQGESDGPFVELKEVAGGFMIITASSVDGLINRRHRFHAPRSGSLANESADEEKVPDTVTLS